MRNAHPRPWHRHSQFGQGPRLPMCRERRAIWKARLELFRRAGQITDGASHVGLALIKRLSQDGRCDPSHETLAVDSGESVSTVKRALKTLRACGLVTWVRRLTRDGWRAVQTSNAYMLTLGEPVKVPVIRCDGQNGRETRRIDIIPTAQAAPAKDVAAAQAALTNRRKIAREGAPIGLDERSRAGAAQRGSFSCMLVVIVTQ
jgi:hypothetical protein